ncbi:MAG: surface-adhesin E family protein [Betaproteobacteria bacterium]
MRPERARPSDSETLRRPSRRPACRALPAALLLCMVGAFCLAPDTWAQPAVPAAPPRAEPPWEKLGETPVLTLYMDRASIQREGAIRRVFEMQDLKAPDPEGVLSRRYVNEYDCDNQMHRIGRMTSWSGALLTGRKLFDVSDWGYWRKIPANGLFTLGFRMVCPLRAGEALGG